MLSLAAREWIAEGKVEGIAIGRAEGEARGLHEGQARTLLRQLRRRFGPLAPDVEARVREADGTRLDDWGERILDAHELDDVFSNDQTH